MASPSGPRLASVPDVVKTGHTRVLGLFPHRWRSAAEELAEDAGAPRDRSRLRLEDQHSGPLAQQAATVPGSAAVLAAIVSTVAAGPDAVANNSLSPIHFDAGTTQIRPSIRRSWMAWLGRKLAQCLRIEGYADSVGDREPVGSGPRAAKAYLVSRGVPAERITASAGGGVPSRMHPVLAVSSTRPRQAIEQERLPAFCAVTGIEATECPWSRPAHYRFRTTSSRRRFFARPCSVSLGATGFSCP